MTVQKMVPLADRIVVKRLEESEQTAGGIYIPDSAKEKPQKAEVLFVGPGKVLESGAREKMEVEVGDIVLFAKYGGNEIKIDGQEYIILSVRDVLVILK